MLLESHSSLHGKLVSFVTSYMILIVSIFKNVDDGCSY